MHAGPRISGLALLMVDTGPEMGIRGPKALNGSDGSVVHQALAETI